MVLWCNKVQVQSTWAKPFTSNCPEEFMEGGTILLSLMLTKYLSSTMALLAEHVRDSFISGGGRAGSGDDGDDE
eukprot:1977950-Ditylum_brightwellii.AAC.2